MIARALQPSVVLRLLLVVSLLAAASCGSLGQHQPANGGAASEPVELTLTMADRTQLDLGSLRGRRLLLFVFTTFDDASQLALAPLEQVLKQPHQPQALGIAVQPDPSQLLALYRETLGVSFPLGYDPENRIVAGSSMLGPIETVPTYLLLDANGRIVGRHVGAMTAAELEKFLAP